MKHAVRGAQNALKLRSFLKKKKTTVLLALPHIEAQYIYICISLHLALSRHPPHSHSFLAFFSFKNPTLACKSHQSYRPTAMCIWYILRLYISIYVFLLLLRPRCASLAIYEFLFKFASVYLAVYLPYLSGFYLLRF